MTRPHSAGEDGSALIEVIAGIGMLALLTVSLLTFHLGWLNAEERTQVRIAALDLGSAELERSVLVPARDAVQASGDGPRGLRWLREELPVVTWAPDACMSGRRGATRGAVVVVGRDTDGPDPADVLLLASAPIEPGSVRASAVNGFVEPFAVRVVGALPGSASFLVVQDGDAREVTMDPDGCLVLTGLAPGRYEIRPLEVGIDVASVDAAHRSFADSRFVGSVLDRGELRTWARSVPAILSVGIDASGARLPDTISSGSLRWLVRGDDARVVTDLEASRSLHPGPTTVVVSACGHPEAVGSTVSTHLQAGVTTHVDVPLATVTLRGVAAWPDQAVYAIRAAGCADSSGLRPILRWEGGLDEGMRIALPHGVWEARVETMGGAGISSPILIPAGTVDLEVTFP